MSDNLFSVLSDHFPEDRKAIFMEMADGRRISYQDLLDQTAQYANFLTKLGVAPGDRVIVKVEKTAEALMLYLATVRAGAIYLPLNPAYTTSEFRYFLTDAGPKLVVCDPDQLDEVQTIALELDIPSVKSLGADGAGSLVAELNSMPQRFDTVSRAPDDICALLYTSGTTGQSKGAMLTHQNLSSNAQALKETWHYSAADRLLHALPIFHTHGLFTATNTILMAGASMLFLPKFDVDEVVRLLPRATSMMGVPTFYSRLLQSEEFTAELVKHIRVFVSGSAPLSAEVHAEFQKRTGHAILERYGMTETGMNTSNPYIGERKAGTVGLPLPDVEIQITDSASGEVFPQGEVGMIEVRGPNVFRGYWRKPEKTAEDIREDGFFVTGDMGKIDEDGYVHILGREKDLIITGGFNVYPAEIEAVIDAIPGVAESAVIGLPHRDFGEGVTAVVVRKPKTEIDESDILDQMAAQLARYKLPKHIFFLDALPRNSMGKIQKKDLREMYQDTYS